MTDNVTEDRVAPRTAAGQKLAEWMRTNGATARPGITADDSILAIEAEAASLDSDELRKALRDAYIAYENAIPMQDDWWPDLDRAILAVITEPCWTCKGSGTVEGIGADPLPSGEPGEPYQVQEQCPECGGILRALLSAGDKAEAPR